MHWRTWMACGLALSLAPARVMAQEQPRWDVAAFAALFTSHSATDPADGYQEAWFPAAQGGVSLGRHLTKHLKLELEVSGTTSGSRYISRPVDLPGQSYPYWVSSELTTSVRSVAGVLGWQFRDNEWVHPFVQAGISADVTRSRLYMPEYYLSRPLPPGVTSDRLASDTVETTATDLRAVVAGGAKLYFRERAFVRTDARLTFGASQHNLAFRVGVGVDF